AFAPTASGAHKIHTFRIRNATAPNLLTITTPTAYVTNYFPDPFAMTKGATFGYYADTAGWILISFGPDTDETVTPPGDLYKGLPACTTAGAASILAQTTSESAYSGSVSQPSPTLIAGPFTGGDAFTYDATNGTVSQGDVWRVKQ
ncbi:MAG: hypothetical protein V2A74_11820, partial [bacterium]